MVKVDAVMFVTDDANAKTPPNAPVQLASLASRHHRWRIGANHVHRRRCNWQVDLADRRRRSGGAQ